MPRPQPGLIALSAFFAIGAIIATLTSIALLTPGSALEPMWRLNPQAQVAFRAMGRWAIALMLAREGPLRERVERKFPTGALASLAFRRIGWNDLEGGLGELVDLIVPRSVG